MDELVSPIGIWTKPSEPGPYSLVPISPKNEQKTIYKGDNTIGMIRRATRLGVRGWSVTIQGFVFNSTPEDGIKMATTTCKFYGKKQEMYDALDQIFG